MTALFSQEGPEDRHRVRAQQVAVEGLQDREGAGPGWPGQNGEVGDAQRVDDRPGQPGFARESAPQLGTDLEGNNFGLSQGLAS